MKKNVKTILFLLLSIIVCSSIGTMLAKYRSQTTANKELEIAYYVVETQHETQQLKLAAMVPREEPYKYGITILNSKNGRASETAIEYNIQIRTTTNLPLQFSIVKEGENENQIFETQTVQDTDGVYYIKMNTGLKEFGLTKEQHNYVLEITFPKEYKANSEYADIIELVEITVDSKQKI